MNDIHIEPLPVPPSERDLGALAQMLHAAVHGGAAVSFLDSLTLDEAAAWWRRAFDQAHARAVFLGARSDGELVGTVQLQPAWAPNQPHRGEVCKLIVHERHRKSGIGERLMAAVEDHARARGFTLLTLDARRGEAAERLYRRLGWTCVGVIPDFAVDPDGRNLHDTVVFYRQLARPGA